MYQDDLTKKIANAAKEVLENKKVKETEVQPSDKDFVDLHSIDKGKRRGSTPLTEKDIDEANEFTKAAAKAAVAGDDEFEFDGKKFPTEMDVEVAKKILGESTELDEATMSSGVKMAGERIYALEKQLKVGSAVNKGVNKALGGKYDGDFKDMTKAIDKVISVWEEIEFQYGQSESTNVDESVDLDEAYIDVDTADPKSIEFAKLMKKYRVKGRIITMKGPGGGMPLVRLTGKKKDLEGILKDPKGWQDDGFLAGFIEESANPGKAIEEAIKGLSEEQIDELIGGLLKKGAKALGKAVKSRVTKSGRQDRADKKHKLDVRGKKLEIKKKINDILDKKSKAQKKKRDVEKDSKAAKALDDKIDGYKTRIDQLKDKMNDIVESDIEESNS
jgi:hypothetical protein